MAQAIAFTSWGKGELSQNVRGRIDTEMYYSSAAELRNLLVRPYGNICRRAGTWYKANVKDSTKDARLLEFVFNIEEAYILEMGPLYFKIRDIDGNPVVVNLDEVDPWTLAVDYVDGNVVKTGSTKYYVCIEKHTSESSNQPGLSGGVGLWYEWTFAENMDGEWEVEIAHPYTEAQLWEIDYVQKDDAMTIVHHLIAPLELRRYADGVWAIVDAVIEGAPWGELNQDVKNRMWVNNKDVTDPIEDSGAVRTYKTEKDTFTDADVGRFFLLEDINADGEQGYFKVTSVVGPREANGHNYVAIKTTKKTVRWTRQAFDEENYPSIVLYHEGRLVFMNTPSDMSSAWFSKTFIYRDFNYTDKDDGGFKLELNTVQSNPINWASSGDSLAIGTYGAEYVAASPNNGSLSDETKNAREQTSWGGEKIKAKRIGARTYYVQRGRRKLRELYFIWDNNNYDAVDMTEYADHITESGIVDMDYQRNQDAFLWCVLSNGKMAVFSRQAAAEVQAWTPFITDGEVKSIRFLPNKDGLSDRGWMIVERTVDGLPEKHIEYFDTHVVEDSTDLDAMPFLDSMIIPDITFGAEASYEDTADNALVIKDNPDKEHYYEATLDNPLNVSINTNTDKYIASTLGDDITIGRNGSDYELNATTYYFTSGDRFKTIKFISADGTVLMRLYILKSTAGKVILSSLISGTYQGDGTYAGGTWGFDEEDILTPAPWLLTAGSSVLWTPGFSGLSIKTIDSAGSELARFQLTRYISSTVFEATLTSGDIPEEEVDGGKWGFTSHPILTTHDYLLECDTDYFDSEWVGNEIYGIDAIGNPIFVFEITEYDDEKNVKAIFTGDDGAKFWLDWQIGISGEITIDGSFWAQEDAIITPAEDFETNLLPLEDKTVSVFGDGNYAGDIKVQGGAIPALLFSLYDSIVVGLPYTSRLKTNPINAETPSGIAKGKIQRIHKLAIQMHRSRGLECGDKEDALLPVLPPEGIDPDAVFTGTSSNIHFDGGLDYDACIIVQQTKPYPMTILGLFPRIQINEGL